MLSKGGKNGYEVVLALVELSLGVGKFGLGFEKLEGRFFVHDLTLFVLDLQLVVEIFDFGILKLQIPSA